jgi:HEAT repeat protein
MVPQESNPSTTPPLSPDAGADASRPLGDVYKALKATGFYPKKHPARLQLISQAHHALSRLMAGRELLLVTSRLGFTETDGGRKVTPTPMTGALARELFVRSIRRLTVLPDLTTDDLRGFLFLLTISPQDIEAAGGMERLMAEHGIRTIWSNEIDMAAILAKRQAIETAAHPFVDAEDNPSLHGEGTESPFDGFDLEMAPAEDHSMMEQLARMEKEQDDGRYMELAKELARMADDAKRTRRFAELLPVLSGLQAQGRNAAASPFIREYAAFTFEQIAGGTMLEFMLKNLQTRDCQFRDLLLELLPSLGTTGVYAILQQICVAEDLYARKILATALVRIGEPAVPPTVTMLQDDRWYVVRNMVAILGEIGSTSCIPALRKPAAHPDDRVRKETIRSLSRLKSREAESMIIDLLQDRQADIRRQAINSLGHIKSQLAVQPLMQTVLRADLLLRRTPLKKEAIGALGRIGDRQAVQPLARIVDTPAIFFWRATEELKIAAAAALGAIGDETVIPLLAKRARRGGRLGPACRDAIETIERVT